MKKHESKVLLNIVFSLSPSAFRRLPYPCRQLCSAFCLLLSAFCLLPSVPAQAQNDVVLRAMRDELNRSMQQLQLEKLEKPYFIAYRVQEKSAADVTAAFGAVVASSAMRLRFLTVEVRVGSPKMDNTNFLSMSFLSRGGLAGGFGGMAQLPLEDNYKELRRQIWLATDNAYKKALEDLSRKRAALQNKTSAEELPDFSTQKPNTTIEPYAPAKIEVSSLESLARNLSAVFKSSPNIFTESAHVTADRTYTWYVTSEGTTFTRVNPTASVVLLAGTQAADGAPLRDFVAAYGHSLKDPLGEPGPYPARRRSNSLRPPARSALWLARHRDGPRQEVGRIAVLKGLEITDIPIKDAIATNRRLDQRFFDVIKDLEAKV